MTHQSIAEDREIAAAISKHAELKGRTPCILAGHEHVPIIEKEGSCLIVKVGQDASQIGFVDVWWAADGTLQSSVSMLQASQFPLEQSAEAFVRRQKNFLDRTMGEPICELPEAMSSENVRFEQGGIGTFLMSLVKRGLHEHGVEIALLNAGNIRGRKHYEPGPFTMKDLYTENPWDNDMAIVPLPGKVLADAIRATRSRAGEKPSFLHADRDAEVTGQHELVKVNGEPFDPSRTYRVAILVNLLEGMDNVAPLVDYVNASGLHVPDVEACKPSKLITMRICMKDVWHRLLGHPDAHENLSSSERKAFARQAFNQLDVNKDGEVSVEECRKFLKARGAGLVQQLIEVIDEDGDGKICKEEFIEYLFQEQGEQTPDDRQLQSMVSKSAREQSSQPQAIRETSIVVQAGKKAGKKAKRGKTAKSQPCFEAVCLSICGGS